MRIRFSAILFVAFFCASISQAQTTIGQVLTAIRQVESGGEPDNGEHAKGDKGKAVGPFQIHKVYWQDAVSWKHSTVKEIAYEDCNLTDPARQVVLNYMRRWEPAAFKMVDARTLAMLHHYGPSWRNRNDDPHGYWAKVQKELP